MAEEKKIATGYIGNALRSTAADHTTTFTDEVFDTERQKYQSEVNTDIEERIEAEKNRAEAAEEAIIYDVSTHNNDMVFESLSALLSSSDLSTLIPTSVRHGGMSIRFIQGSAQSSDNKYVQYRLMADTFSTTESDWQGVDDEPVDRSHNLVESGGVAKILYGEIIETNIQSSKTYAGYIDSNGRVQGYATLGIAFFPIEKDKIYEIAVEKATNSAGYELSYAENLASIQMQPITDAGMGTSAPFTYSYTALADGYLVVGYYGGTAIPIVIKISQARGLVDKIKDLEDEVSELNSQQVALSGTVDDLDEQINGHNIQIDVDCVETKLDTYCDPGTNKVQIYAGNNLALACFPITSGEIYYISVAKTTNSAGYILSYAETIGSIDITPIINTLGNRDSFTYTYISEYSGYLFIGISADSPYTIVKRSVKSGGIANDVERLKQNGIDWSGKKWFVIGDSLSTLNSTTTKRYIDYIVEKTGINAIVRAVGGSSWGQPQLTDAFFKQAIDTPTDTDIVTIFGSFNSWRSSEGDGPSSGKGSVEDEGINTYYGCVNTCFKNIYDKAPLAKVGVIFPTPWSTQNSFTYNETAETLISVIDSASKKWGIPTLDLFRGSGMRPWDLTYRQLVYSKDSGGIDGNPAGVHPNEIGHEIIASHVLEFMKSLML